MVLFAGRTYGLCYDFFYSFVGDRLHTRPGTIPK
jgi:hypothetical protein